MTDTDDKIRRVYDNMDKRLGDFAAQNRDGFDELKSIVKDTNREIINTRLEVVAIKTSINALATKTQVLEQIATVKDWIGEKMQEHVEKKHRSKPPLASINPRLRMMGALIGAVVALTGAIVALTQLL